VATVSRATREISHGLHPSQLEHLGLAVSVNKLCRDMNAGGKLTVRFSSHNFPEQIPSAVAVCLYRVVQESLRNVATHSRATTASIELRAEDGRIRLRISDNGVGFVYGRQPSGLGLISMRERVRAIGGSLEIASSPGAGTQIEVNVPLLGGSTASNAGDAA
jgi:signal transduction histidine kinase